jgi:hypothetical protein
MSDVQTVQAGFQPSHGRMRGWLRKGVNATVLGLSLAALQGCSHLNRAADLPWKAGDPLVLEVTTEILEPAERWTRNGTRGEAFFNGGLTWGATGLIFGGLLICPIATWFAPASAYEACTTALVETGFVLGGLVSVQRGGQEGDNARVQARIDRMDRLLEPKQRLHAELEKRLARHWTLNPIEFGPQPPPGVSRVDVVLRGPTVYREDRNQIRIGLRADVRITLIGKKTSESLSYEHHSGFVSMRAWQDAQDDYLETSLSNGLRQLAARITSDLLDRVN